MADDEHAERDIETVRDWLIRTYGREHELTTSVDSEGTTRALLRVTRTGDHPELSVEVLEAWQNLIHSEQRHLDEAQRVLERQPNHARMVERAAAEEDPSRREEREAEQW